MPTVQEIVSLLLKLDADSRRQVYSAIRQYMADVGELEFAEKYPYTNKVGSPIDDCGSTPASRRDVDAVATQHDELLLHPVRPVQAVVATLLRHGVGPRAWIDGASRGNPGPAAWAAVVYLSDDPNNHPVLLGGYLGQQTNNYAEWTALVELLKYAVATRLSSLAVYSDSELLVKQFNGDYRVKSPMLKAFANEAFALSRQVPVFSLSHIPREQNKQADAYVNKILNQHGV